MGLKLAITALLALMMSGCATWSPETRIEESAYQGLHAADTLQTIQIGKSGGRFYENESEAIIGREPRVGPTIAYMGALAGVHAAITDQLEKHDAPRWVRRCWELGSISWSGAHVAHNTQVGIKVKF